MIKGTPEERSPGGYLHINDKNLNAGPQCVQSDANGYSKDHQGKRIMYPGSSKEDSLRGDCPRLMKQGDARNCPKQGNSGEDRLMQGHDMQRSHGPGQPCSGHDRSVQGNESLRSSDQNEKSDTSGEVRSSSPGGEKTSQS
jgi:hypothetical protein